MDQFTKVLLLAIDKAHIVPRLLTMLVKGKQTCHTKVSSKHSLNKVSDTKSGLVKPVVHSFAFSCMTTIEVGIMYDHILYGTIMKT